ncbi:tubulin-tyrosine ligase/Tubulin polyglutamylase [Kipferlia bialata]|uniref:Tubulin-tyrosine ligase/Tubulin polyglutamylase n=1 Tax=Kipferlia bialata TaxID=797122 RepID=A0A9K3CMS2_9EUKA|nr:tubulin-tyrosine ligase/Tubulin polyglutamylase [Kipferlia bialata]|eukprot:g621.t1
MLPLSHLETVTDRKVDDFFMPAMTHIVKQSLLAVAGKIGTQGTTNSFELFGYDLMLDEDLNMTLIEVNTNPCIAFESEVSYQLLPRLLDDMFALTIDQVFSPPRNCAQRLAAAPPGSDAPPPAGKRKERLEALTNIRWGAEGVRSFENGWVQVLKGWRSYGRR